MAFQPTKEKTMPEEVVTIPKKEYDSLLDDARKLQALESAGVDNWTWYDVAMEEYRDGLV
jgi:hypothetical protein